MTVTRGSLRSILAGALVLAGGISCGLGPAATETQLRLTRADAQGDTLSPFPTLQITFGGQLEDSVVDLAIVPPFPCAWSAWLNSGHDTLTIRVTGVLDGDARYVIRPASTIAGTDGGRLRPSEDSLVIYTWSRETGQNRTAATADTLAGRLFGMLDLAGDTAFFITDARACRIRSWEGMARLAMSDAQEWVGGSDAVNTGESDTVIAPDSLEGPFMVRIHADPLQAGVRFEVTAD